MGQSIGDLFVKLGFEVDDSKLKSFDASIKDVFSTVMKFAGVTASAAGFVELTKGASDTALTLDNLTQKFGTSTKAAQDFASAIHQLNPLISRDQGIGAFGHFAEYLNNAATKGTGASALNQLGVRFNTADMQHPERLINQLLTTVPQLIAQHPEQRGRYADLLDQLFGNINSINTFSRGKGVYEDAAAKGFVSQGDLDRQAEARKNIAEMGNLWDAFISHATGTLAAAINELAKDIKNPLPEDKDHNILAGIGRFTDWVGAQDPFGLGSRNSVFGALVQTGEAIGGGVKSSVSTGHKMTDLRNYLVKQGWSQEQAEGIVKRLNLESGLRTDAVGDGGKAYGLAQWHPDRQANFQKWAGKSIIGSSMEDQIAFVNYELTKGLEKSAGDKLKQTRTKDEAYDSFTKNYERPAEVNLTVTQHITSSDPEQAGRAATQTLQEHITAAYINRLGVTP